MSRSKNVSDSGPRNLHSGAVSGARNCQDIAISGSCDLFSLKLGIVLLIFGWFMQRFIYFEERNNMSRFNTHLK